MSARYKDWMSQAENDLDWGNDSCSNGFYAQSCFISQQSSEKALKALALFRGEDMVKSHSVKMIAKALGINSEIEAAAAKLDLYYITSRYPDSLPEGAPHEMFTEEQAKEALALAEMIVKKVRQEVK